MPLFRARERAVAAGQLQANLGVVAEVHHASHPRRHRVAPSTTGDSDHRTGDSDHRTELDAFRTHQQSHVLAVSEEALELHIRSAEHTSELQSLMRISYAGFCFNKK